MTPDRTPAHPRRTKNRLDSVLEVRASQLGCGCCGLSRRDFLQLTSLFSSSLAATLAIGGCQNGQGAATNPAPNPTPPTSPASAAGLPPVKIGYLPITDAAPLLVAHARKLYEAEGLTAEKPTLFRSWPQVIEAFLAKQVNVIHILMPATLWLRYGRKVPAKIVAWNHTNGSALTVLPEIDRVEDLGGRTVAVPFWYSIHNVVLQQLLKKAGLKVVRRPKDAKPAKDEVNLVVLPPPDMVSALANKSIAGYIVAEPFNAAAENLKTGKILRFTGDVWKDHACCVVLIHEDDLTQRPEWAKRVVQAIVKAQHWSGEHRAEVAEILSKEGGKYTPHPKAALTRALTAYDPAVYGPSKALTHPDWQLDRIDFQPYPFPSYTAELVRLLKETEVEGNAGFLKDLNPEWIAKDLVDDSFVKAALAAVGGPAAFKLPESLTRTETIAL